MQRLTSLPKTIFHRAGRLVDGDRCGWKAGSKLALAGRARCSSTSIRNGPGVAVGPYKAVSIGCSTASAHVHATRRRRKFTSSVSADAPLLELERHARLPASLSVGERGSGSQFYETLTGATTGLRQRSQLELQARVGHVYSRQTTPG